MEEVKFIENSPANVLRDFEMFYTPSWEEAIETGDIYAVEILHRRNKKGYKKKFISAAVSNGHFEVVDFLLKNKPVETEYLMEDAAAVNNIEMIKFLHSRNVKGHQYAINIATESGYFEIVKYLLSLGFKASPISISAAAAEGNYELVKDVYGLLEEKDIQDIKIFACKNGFFSIIEFMHKQGETFGHEEISLAIERNHAKLIDYFKSINKL